MDVLSSQVQPFSLIMIILATILGISVFIERTLELLSHLADFLLLLESTTENHQ
jgi:hypothetical protein